MNKNISFDIGKFDSIINKEKKYDVFLEKEDYTYERENEACYELDKYLTCKDSMIRFYRKILQDSQKPDLLGKTVECNEKQFPNVYKTIKQISYILNIAVPRVYVYEDVYYKAEVDGYDEPWIIISSKIIEDYTREELLFVLGKILASIKNEHYKYEATVKGLYESTKYIDRIPLISLANSFNIIDGYKMNLEPKINCYRRCGHFSTDACGFLICGSFKAAVSAILKDILNNSKLVSEVDLRDYMKKVNEIKSMSGKMIDYSKLDEAVPYGPYRVLNLLRFSTTERFSNSILKLSREYGLWD